MYTHCFHVYTTNVQQTSNQDVGNLRLTWQGRRGLFIKLQILLKIVALPGTATMRSLAPPAFCRCHMQAKAHSSPQQLPGHGGTVGKTSLAHSLPALPRNTYRKSPRISMSETCCGLMVCILSFFLSFRLWERAGGPGLYTSISPSQLALPLGGSFVFHTRHCLQQL